MIPGQANEAELFARPAMDRDAPPRNGNVAKTWHCPRANDAAATSRRRAHAGDVRVCWQEWRE